MESLNRYGSWDKEHVAVKFTFMSCAVLLFNLQSVAFSQTVLEGHTDRVRYVGFLPDGTTLLTGSEDYTVRLWDVTKPQPAQMWQQLSAFTPGPSTVLLSISADGHTLARGGAAQGSAELWDVQKRSKTSSISAHQKPLLGVALSSDGSTLVTFSQDELKAWTSKGKMLFGIGAPNLYSLSCGKCES